MSLEGQEPVPDKDFSLQFEQESAESELDSNQELSAQAQFDADGREIETGVEYYEEGEQSPYGDEVLEMDNGENGNDIIEEIDNENDELSASASSTREFDSLNATGQSASQYLEAFGRTDYDLEQQHRSSQHQNALFDSTSSPTSSQSALSSQFPTGAAIGPNFALKVPRALRKKLAPANTPSRRIGLVLNVGGTQVSTRESHDYGAYKRATRGFEQNFRSFPERRASYPFNWEAIVSARANGKTAARYSDQPNIFCNNFLSPLDDPQDILISSYRDTLMLSRFRALKFSGNLSARRIVNASKQHKLVSEQLDESDEDYFRFELKMMYVDIKEEKKWKIAVAKELAQEAVLFLTKNMKRHCVEIENTECMVIDQDESSLDNDQFLFFGSSKGMFVLRNQTPLGTSATYQFDLSKSMRAKHYRSPVQVNGNRRSLTGSNSAIQNTSNKRASSEASGSVFDIFQRTVGFNDSTIRKQSTFSSAKANNSNTSLDSMNSPIEKASKFNNSNVKSELAEGNYAVKDDSSATASPQKVNEKLASWVARDRNAEFMSVFDIFQKQTNFNDATIRKKKLSSSEVSVDEKNSESVVSGNNNNSSINNSNNNNSSNRSFDSHDGNAQMTFFDDFPAVGDFGYDFAFENGPESTLYSSLNDMLSENQYDTFGIAFARKNSETHDANGNEIVPSTGSVANTNNNNNSLAIATTNNESNSSTSQANSNAQQLTTTNNNRRRESVIDERERRDGERSSGNAERDSRLQVSESQRKQREARLARRETAFSSATIPNLASGANANSNSKREATASGGDGNTMKRHRDRTEQEASEDSDSDFQGPAMGDADHSSSSDSGLMDDENEEDHGKATGAVQYKVRKFRSDKRTKKHKRHSTSNNTNSGDPGKEESEKKKKKKKSTDDSESERRVKKPKFEVVQIQVPADVRERKFQFKQTVVFAPRKTEGSESKGDMK